MTEPPQNPTGSRAIMRPAFITDPRPGVAFSEMVRRMQARILTELREAMNAAVPDEDPGLPACWPARDALPTTDPEDC